jgi:hypothetical protein
MRTYLNEKVASAVYKTEINNSRGPQNFNQLRRSVGIVRLLPRSNGIYIPIFPAVIYIYICFYFIEILDNPELYYN